MTVGVVVAVLDALGLLVLVVVGVMVLEAVGEVVALNVGVKVGVTVPMLVLLGVGVCVRVQVGVTVGELKSLAARTAILGLVFGGSGALGFLPQAENRTENMRAVQIGKQNFLMFNLTLWVGWVLRCIACLLK